METEEKMTTQEAEEALGSLKMNCCIWPLIIVCLTAIVITAIIKLV
jgi:hypothetical protein